MRAASSGFEAPPQATRKATGAATERRLDFEQEGSVPLGNVCRRSTEAAGQPVSSFGRDPRSRDQEFDHDEQHEQPILQPRLHDDG